MVVNCELQEPPTNGIAAGTVAAAASWSSAMGDSLMQLEPVVLDDANEEEERFELPDGDNESTVFCVMPLRSAEL